MIKCTICENHQRTGAKHTCSKCKTKTIYERKKPAYNAEYRREQYIKHREKILQKQKEYDDQHREEINRKARARYRAKCGLKPIKEAE